MHHVELVRNVDSREPTQASGVRPHWDRIPGEITGQMRSGVGWGSRQGSGVVSEGRDDECLPIAPSCLHVPMI